MMTPLIFEIEAFARKITKFSPNHSMKLFFFWLELCRHTQGQKDVVVTVPTIIKAMDGDLNNPKSYIQPLKEIGIISVEHEDRISPKTATQHYPLPRIHLTQDVLMVDICSYDGVITKKIIDITKLVIKKNNRLSNLFLLNCIAIFARKIHDSGEVSQFVNLHRIKEHRFNRRFIDALKENGFIYIVEKTSNPKSGVIIIPVEE